MIEFRYKLWKILKAFFAFNEKQLIKLLSFNENRLGSVIDQLEGEDCFTEMEFEIEDLLRE